MKNLIILLLLFVTLSCSKNINDLDYREEIFWEQTASIDKRVDVLIIDSKDNILIGTTNGRIYRSTDDGKNWTYINSKMLSLIFNVNSIVVNSKGHIFFSDGQIYRSTDDGQNWIEVSNNKIRANDLLISSNDEIFACAYGGGRVYRSTDNGESWIIPDGAVKYFTPNTLKLNSKGHLFAKSDNGLYKSLDYGNTWTKIKDGYVYALALNNVEEIFIVTGDAYNKSFYTSKDYGWSWSRVSTVTITDLVINSKGIMYGVNGTIGMVRSVDGGKSWQEIKNGLTQSFVRKVALNSKGYIFAGTASYNKYSQLEKGEVFKSTKSTLE